MGLTYEPFATRNHVTFLMEKLWVAADKIRMRPQWCYFHPLDDEFAYSHYLSVEKCIGYSKEKLHMITSGLIS